MQALEQFALARIGEFLSEPGQHLVEQRHGPAVLENFLWTALVHRFEPVAFLRRLRIERENLAPAAPLLSIRAVPYVGHVVIERGEQEGAELAFLPLDALNGSPFEQLSKKSLGQVLRVLLAVAASLQICVNGIPVSAAEFFERFNSLWRINPACGEYDAPVRRGELSGGSLA